MTSMITFINRATDRLPEGRGVGDGSRLTDAGASCYRTSPCQRRAARSRRHRAPPGRGARRRRRRPLPRGQDTRRGRNAGDLAVPGRPREPDLPGRLPGGALRAPPAAARRHPGQRARHGARVPRPVGALPGLSAGAARLRLLRRRGGDRRAVLRDGAPPRRRRAARGAGPVRRRRRTRSQNRKLSHRDDRHAGRLPRRRLPRRRSGDAGQARRLPRAPGVGLDGALGARQDEGPAGREGRRRLAREPHAGVADPPRWCTTTGGSTTWR